MKKKKVFVIVPNEILKKYFKTLFLSINCQLKIFLSSDNIIDEIEQDTPDCIFIYNGIKDTENRNIHTLIMSRLLNTKIIFVIYSFTNIINEYEDEYNNVHFLKFPLSEREFLIKFDKIINNKKTILYVDDSKVMHTQIVNFLKANNYIVYQGYNGEDGLKILETHKPDLILSDIEMPKIDGYEFCKLVKAKSENEKIPFVILSSLSSGIDVDRGFDAGANDYLTKPVDTDELLYRLSDLLNEKKKMTREKILVVDDSKTIRNLVQQTLEQQGFKVYLASNGKEALVKAKEVEPDLITTDYEMPEMNGWELCNLLRKDKQLKNIPVIVITSKTSKADKAKIRSTGAKECLTKPFNNDKLVVIVERLLAESHMEREREILKFYVSDAVLSQTFGHKFTTANLIESMEAKEIFATVLFSDIVSFTPLCEKMEPKEIISLLNNYFDLMCTILKKHNAIIDKFIGDAIMAIFGDGVRGVMNAAEASIEMVNELKKFNKKRKIPLNMRIGINSGKLFFGDIGSKLFRRDFTVIGDNVNIGQRLESACKVNSIYISESTYQLIKNNVDAKYVGPLELKGKKKTIKTYELKNLKNVE